MIQSQFAKQIVNNEFIVNSPFFHEFTKNSPWIHYFANSPWIHFIHDFTLKSLWIHYTQCTLKLRPVKLLFVIIGRLSYSFFIHLMVWGNGRLSDLIFENHPFYIEKWPIFDQFFTWGDSNGLYYDFFVNSFNQKLHLYP